MKINWTQAKKEYISDVRMSYEKIAIKHGISNEAVEKRGRKEKWPELRKTVSAKITEKMPEKIGESIAQYQARKFIMGKEVAGKAYQILMDPETKIGSRTAGELLDKAVDWQDEALGVDQGKNINVQVVIPILGPDIEVK